MARRVQTSVGTILVLVCDDAAIFSARSRSNLGNSLGLSIREHFMQQVHTEPRPTYILIATHWQGTNPETGRWSGEAFRQAADYLSSEVPTVDDNPCGTPRHELASAASASSGSLGHALKRRRLFGEATHHNLHDFAEAGRKAAAATAAT